MELNKIIMGIIISIITLISLKFKKINIVICLSLILGLYELIKNISKDLNNLSLMIGIVIIIICSDMVSNNLFTCNDIFNIIIIIVISDSFQELVGKMYGRNKIGWISPNKSIEGYIGGYIGILIYYFISNTNFYFVNIIFLLGIIGDLFFSYIKRNLDIKDYSDILLSHGGILDRLDSFIFAILGYGLYKQCNIIENS